MVSYKNLFYFDIETVGQYPTLDDLQKNDEKGYELFLKKYNKNSWMREGNMKSLTPAQSYINYAPIFSTYGKIVCISFGYYHNKNDNGYTIRSLFGDNEEQLLREIQELFLKVSSKHMYLSGYNINAFDIPWVSHKMNKYDIQIPPVLRIYGKKPWEYQTVDLFEAWKSTYRYFTSFDEVCYELGVPSPKQNIDGSMVHETFWEENDLDKIVNYCEDDIYSSLLVGKKMLDGNV